MSDSTVYLTFDDGPLGGTDDVIATLNEMKVRGLTPAGRGGNRGER